MKTAIRERRLFAEILIREGITTPDCMKRAVQIQGQTGETLEEVLVQEGNLTEWDLARTLVKHYKLPFIPLSRYEVSKDIVELLPVELLRENMMMPMDRFGNTITLAIARNPEPGLKEHILEEHQLHCAFFVSTLTDVKNALNLHFPTPFSEFDGLLTDVKQSFSELGGEWDLANGDES